MKSFFVVKISLYTVVSAVLKTLQHHYSRNISLGERLLAIPLAAAVVYETSRSKRQRVNQL